MTTRHLSLSVTCYGDGRWSIGVLQTVCEPGRPARAEAIRCVPTDLPGVLEHGTRWLKVITEIERARVAAESAAGDYAT